MKHQISLLVLLLLVMATEAQASATAVDITMERGFTIWGVCHEMATYGRLPEAMNTSGCIKTVRGWYPGLNPRRIRKGRTLRFPQAQKDEVQNIQATNAALPTPLSPSMNSQTSVGPELESLRAQVTDAQNQIGQLMTEVRDVNVLLKTEHETNTDLAKRIHTIASKLEKGYVSRQTLWGWFVVGLAMGVIAIAICLIAGRMVYSKNQKEGASWTKVNDKLASTSEQAVTLTQPETKEEFLFDIDDELYGGEFSNVTLALRLASAPRCYLPCGAETTAASGNVFRHLTRCLQCKEAIRAEVAAEAA